MLELIHSYICDSMHINSVGGSKYFVSFINDYLWFIAVYIVCMIKQKSEAFTEFKTFLNLHEK